MAKPQRRGSLLGSTADAASKVAAEASPPSPPAPIGASEDMTTTAIHIPRRTLSLLRRVAVARADREGGRPSVSGVLAGLVEEAWAKLESELP
jgi:hypothetical protein